MMWQADIGEQLWCLGFQIQGGRLLIFRNFIIPPDLIWTPRLLVLRNFSIYCSYFPKVGTSFQPLFIEEAEKISRGFHCFIVVG